MRCEVLGYKNAKERVFAIVRLLDSEQPDLIGEVPAGKNCKAERGAVVDLHIRPRVYQGRLEFSASVE